MSLFSDGSAILYMKVGTHAQEDLAEIIARKRREIESAGLAMWGYGGNTCHPTRTVQPFARIHESPTQPILLCMQPMESRHRAEPIRAEEFSADGYTWESVPEGINVLGSRYALCLKAIREVEESLSLGSTRVAIGNNRGRLGSDYIKGRVDKACLEVTAESGGGSSIVPIRFVAELIEPYAVFLRN